MNVKAKAIFVAEVAVALIVIYLVQSKVYSITAMLPGYKAPTA